MRFSFALFFVMDFPIRPLVNTAGLDVQPYKNRSLAVLTTCDGTARHIDRGECLPTIQRRYGQIHHALERLGTRIICFRGVRPRMIVYGRLFLERLEGIVRA